MHQTKTALVSCRLFTFAAYSSQNLAMPIFSAVGLGIALIVLNVLMHPVFTEMEATAIAVLRGAQVSVEAATELAASAATIQFPVK